MVLLKSLAALVATRGGAGHRKRRYRAARLRAMNNIEINIDGTKLVSRAGAGRTTRFCVMPIITRHAEGG